MSTREQVVPPWRPRLARAGLDTLSPLLDVADAPAVPGTWETLHKEGLRGRRRWRWTLPAGIGGDVLYVKRYADTPLSEQWDRARRQVLGHSRAAWEYAVCCRLAQAHINAPAPVGFIERMRGPLERRSAVLLERVPGDGLDRLWTRLCHERAPITRGLARHDLVVRLARFVAAFHETGFCHRDLYLCHIFADIDPLAARPPTFALIDLARVHKPRWRRMRWIIKDLAQLDASARQVGARRSDRWRFLRAYLNLLPRAPRTRWYARRIVRKSNWISRRIARKNQAP